MDIFLKKNHDVLFLFIHVESSLTQSNNLTLYQMININHNSHIKMENFWIQIQK